MTTITLSFDNGPEPAVTPLVLDTLARHAIKATFFVIGQKLETPEGQALIARARREGHWIGNHTYTHTLPLGKLDGDAGVSEITRTEALIGPLAQPSPLFRPYGEGGILDARVLSPAAVDHLCANGYTCISWNAIPRDWENPAGWVETALSQIAAQDETLLVIHDLPTGAMDHLDDFLTRARATGATFRQSFPASCQLILAGRPTTDIAPYVTTPATAD